MRITDLDDRQDLLYYVGILDNLFLADAYKKKAAADKKAAQQQKRASRRGAPTRRR